MKTTKRALGLSVLSLLLCAVMLMGTTFAWFTDSVINTQSKIQTGELAIQLKYRALDSDQTLWLPMEEDTPFFDDQMNWEPGKYFGWRFNISTPSEIENKLALDWVFTFQNIVSTSDQSDVDLADVLVVYVGDANIQNDLSKMTEIGTLSEIRDGKVIKEGKLNYDGQTWGGFSVAIKMKEDADIKYQGATVTFDIVARAKQAASELDGFGNRDYDKDATYATWDGTETDTDWYDPDETNYTLDSPEKLAGLSQMVADGETFKGKTITLTSDIDLGNASWTPIGTEDTPFEGTFDGNEKTIYNLTPSSDGEYTGLFGKTTNATIRDLTIKGGTINATGTNVGAVAGRTVATTVSGVIVDGVSVDGRYGYVGGLVGEGYTGKLENCVVRNATISGGQYIGGISGQGYATITGCSVENCEINGTSWKVGGIIGQLNEGTFTFSDLTVKDTVIRSTSNCVGGIAGFSNYGNKTFKNCNVVDCTIEKSNSSDLTGVAGFVGQIYGQTGNLFTFDQCAVIGLQFVSQRNVSNVGGFVGDGYWRGYEGMTFTFKDCTTQILTVTANQFSNTGAFIGDLASNTVSFEGTNEANTVGTGIDQLIGTRNADASVTGEDTVSFTK